LSAYNSLLAVVKLEKGLSFDEALKKLEEAKQTCISTVKPDDRCHSTSQEALKYTLEIYDCILEDYKKHLPNRSSPPHRI